MMMCTMMPMIVLMRRIGIVIGPVAHRSSVGGCLSVTESLAHEWFVVEEHFEVVSVAEVFECFGGVFDCQFGDMGGGEHVLVNRAVECGCKKIHSKN